MADAQFTPQGVTLALTKEEWWFVSSSIGYVLHGNRLADHDFQNILMMTPDDAELFDNELSALESEAQAAGHHWNPKAPSV